MEYFELQIRGRCVWIWLEQLELAKENLLPNLLAEWEEVLTSIELNDNIEAVVLSHRQKDFAVDIDWTFLFDIKELGVWEGYGRRIHELLQRMEKYPKPIVAAINGDCMGVGIELALVCDYRLATVRSDSIFSFPSVRLGLLPTGGASQRLPRLIGIRGALEMLVMGEEVNVYKAEQIGLVDKLVHPYQLELAAQQQALELVGKKIVRHSKLSALNKLKENTTIGRSMILDRARQQVHQYAYGNYPALLKIIECVAIGYKHGVRAGYELEIKGMDEMVTHPIAKQLIRISFAVQDKRTNPLANHARDISKIGIIGSGKMGENIARQSLVEGFEVVLSDLSEQTLAQVQARIWKYLVDLSKKRFINTKKQGEWMTNLQTTTDYQSFEGMGMVLESVFEEVDLKRQVLSSCMEYLPPNGIYAINTSSISISNIAIHAKKPSQVIGMCYFSPILKSALLEIVVTQDTAKWVIATAIEVGIRQGKIPIVVKDSPGFYTTRILAVLLNEALLLLEEGGDILQVDEAAKQLGFSKGVFELIDEIGIDVGGHIMNGALLQFLRKRHIERRISMGLLELYKAGYRGRKNLNGFYSYHSKIGKRRVGMVDEDVYDFFGGVEKERILFKTKEIRQRLMMVVVNEAAYCLEEGTIFSPQDGDLGAVFGLGFPPFTGGPFRYLDSLGLSMTLKRLERLQDKFGVRFMPAPIIAEMAAQKTSFYEG